MRSSRGKLAAFALAGLGVALVVLVVAFAKDRVIEEWHLRRFRGGDRDTKLDAAKRLADLGSKAAVPMLVEEIRRVLKEEMDRRARAQGGILLGNARQYLDPYSKELLEDLIRIGKPALPELIRARASSDLGTVTVWFLAIDKVDERFDWRHARPSDHTSEPQDWRVLREIASSPGESEEVRAAASQTIEKLEQRWREHRER